MQSLGDAGEDWATLSAGLIANSDGVVKEFARFEHVEDGLGLVAGNVDADFLHGLDDDGIQLAGFKARAFSFELFAADLIQEGFSHLAAGTIVDTNEKDSFLFHSKIVALN